MNLFGSKKKSQQQQQKSTPQDAIQRLMVALDNLEKRESFLQKKIDNELTTAKKLIAAKNKNGAKMALKRKKMYEVQIEKINGTRMTIENQKMALESANFNLDVLQAMSQGAAALQAVNANMTLDAVDDTMDKIQEQMDVANEIADAISQPMGGMDYDDDLEKELADLEAEGLDETLLSVQNAPAAVSNDEPFELPSAPSGHVQLTDEEKELRALEASMAV
eukprot:c11461_g1_i1.p1 GENE.c11461_g1_i1~~c11461_g1_i1.p1  ORF type:complete len:237 (-),score=74.97 c11461_g1_i1:241-903(-)